MAKEKRLNVNMDANLHLAFKTAAVSQGKDMSTVLIELVQRYVKEHYPQGLPPALKKKGDRK